MLSPGSGNTVIKSKLISRSVFNFAAKAVVMVGLIGRLIFKINQATSISLYLIKIDLESGS